MKDFKDPNDCVYYVLDRDINASGVNIYLVGKYDIEDSIDDKYWIKLVKEKCGVTLNNQDMLDLRANLAKNSDAKFEKLLRDKVNKDNNKKINLPSKKIVRKIWQNIYLIKTAFLMTSSNYLKQLN